MQIRTKLGLVDIPNAVIMAAARDIAGSADSTLKIAAPSGSLRCDALVLLPRRPWVASDQYGMRMILSQDNEIVIRADHLPLEMLRAMAQAANTWQENVSDQTRAEDGS